MSQADRPDADYARQQVERACVAWAADLKMLLTGILRNSSTADDALQRTILKAIQSANTVELPTLRGWLFRIAVNEARQLQREAQRDADRIRKVAHDNSSAWWLLADSHLSTAIPTQLETDELARVIQTSLERLPAAQRQVVQKRIYEGQQFSRIASEMGVPLGTVLTWMRRAIEQLRNDPQLRSSVEPD